MTNVGFGSILAKKVTSLLSDLDELTPDEYHSIPALIESFEPNDTLEFIKALNGQHALIKNFIEVDYGIGIGADAESLSASILAKDGCPEATGSMQKWITDSLNDAEKHLSKTQTVVLTTLHPVINIKDGEQEILINIYQQHPNPQVGTILWDSRAHNSINVAVDLLYLSSHEELVFDSPVFVRPWKPKPMYIYHPERYRQSREYVDDIPRLCTEYMLPGRGEMTLEKINVVASAITHEINDVNSMIPLRIRKDENQASILSGITREIETYTLYDQYCANGRKIFHVNPQLAEILSHTDLDDVLVNSLVSPFENYYLHFGAQKSIQYEKGWYFDGAYISHSVQNKLIQIIFTFYPDPIDKARQWTFHKEPSLSLSISPDEYELGLAEALEVVVNRRLDELEEEKGKGDKCINDELRDASIAQDREDIAEALDNFRVYQNAESNASAREAQLEIEVPLMKKALALIANALCYLSSYPDDIDHDWTPDTPKKLIDKARRGHPKVKKNTESKINSMGYRRIYICGRQLSQGPADDSAGGARKVKQHWRRGHWRRQAYGPERTERRLILIKPVLVNMEKGSQVDEGSIYIDKNVVDMKAVKKRLNITRNDY